MALHNRVSQKELKERLYQEKEPRKTISFYKYFHIGETQRFRDDLYQQLSLLNVFGRIYVASEGINAQISVPESNFDSFAAFINNHEKLNNTRLNIAVDDDGKHGTSRIGRSVRKRNAPARCGLRRIPRGSAARYPRPAASMSTQQTDHGHGRPRRVERAPRRDGRHCRPGP